MCVVIIKPAGETLSRETFRDLWTANPHGGGFSVIEPDGTLKVRKSMDRKQFWQWWRSAQVNNGNPLMVMHLRIATHGSINLVNCHPFTIAKDGETVMHHNGILSCAIPNDDDWRSDSRVFAEDILGELPADWLDNPRLFGLVEDATDGSKVVFHSANPRLARELYVMNRWSWKTRDGLLLSNEYGLPFRSAVPKSNWSDWLVPKLPTPLATKSEIDELDDWNDEWQGELKRRAEEDGDIYDIDRRRAMIHTLDAWNDDDIANWEGVSVR